MPQAYEWDEATNDENIAKHGIAFADPHRVFERPMVVRLDDREDYGEDRWIALGDLEGIMSSSSSLDGTVASGISTRKASSRERKTYEESIGGIT